MSAVEKLTLGLDIDADALEDLLEEDNGLREGISEEIEWLRRGSVSVEDLLVRLRTLRGSP